MNFFGNITQRRRQRRRSDTNEELNVTNELSSTLDGTTSSMPNMSDDDNDETRNLRLEIEKLQLELSTAHEEINNLSIENTELKKALKESTSKNQTVIKAAKLLSSELLTPNKSKQQLTTPRRTTKSSQKRKSVDRTRIQETPPKITATPVTPTPVGNPQNIERTKYDVQVQGKQKLCILSTNKTNRILTIASRTFPNYQICHYLTPTCGIKKLVSDVDVKLKDFTMNDYCIIMVGEEDFRQTNNYVELTIYIRETLLKIKHTNVILCLPTYKLSDHSAMFNCRIETFNNLLYLDVCTNNYALLFDSNLNLTCDYEMFLRSNGSLNNHGMTNVFENLSKLINIEKSNRDKCNITHNSCDLEHEGFASPSCSISGANELFFLE